MITAIPKQLYGREEDETEVDNPDETEVYL
jgi:hypothetical protein